MNQRHESAMEAMLCALQEVAEGEERADFNRANVIGILKVLAEHLDPLLEEPLVQDEHGEAVIRHTVVEQLLALASALDDLDTGLTDPIFDPYEHGANATLSWDVRESDAAIIEALRIYQNRYKLMQIAAAAKLAKDLAANGFQRRGKTLSGENLQRLKYPSAKRTK